MHIDELYLREFGKFHDEHIYMDEDIKIFYGENEYGKSTIYAFIKAMLFGLQRGRGRAAATDEYTRYKPWNGSGGYSGIMRFTCGNRHFVLERNFNIYEKSVSLVCADDGEELSVEDGDLEMLLGGLTRQSFENTIAIGQLMSRPENTLAEELQNCAAVYYDTGSDAIDLSGAIEELRNKKKQIEKDIKKIRDEKNTKIEEIRHNCDYVQKSAGKLEEDYNKAEDKLNRLKADLKEIVEIPEEKAEVTGKRPLIKAGITGIAAGLIGRIFGSFLPDGGALLNVQAVKDLSIFIIVIGVILLIAGIIKKRPDNTVEEDVDKRNRSDVERDIHLLKGEMRRIKEEWKENAVSFSNLQEQIIEKEMPGQKENDLLIKKDAIDLAAGRLMEVSTSVSKGFSQVLNEKASAIIERITEGKYSKILIDEKLDMVIIEDGRRIPLNQVSEGTIEQIYFSLRVAAADLLFSEQLPLILDETFAFYDEKRIKSVLKWLREQERQVIIFTCQRRETQILRLD